MARDLELAQKRGCFDEGYRLWLVVCDGLGTDVKFVVIVYIEVYKLGL